MADGYGSPYTGALAGINSTVHSYLPWLMLGQRKDNTAEQAASAQAIESLQKSADSGSFNAYRPAESFSQNPAAINPAVNSPVGQGGYIPPGEQINRLTPQGELAMKIGGQATVDSLQKMSDLKKTELEITLNKKKIEGMSYTADESEKIIKSINSTDTSKWDKKAVDFWLNTKQKVLTELSKQTQIPVDREMLTDQKKYQAARTKAVIEGLERLHTVLGTPEGLTGKNVGEYNGLLAEGLKIGLYDKESIKPHEEFGKQAMQKLFTEKNERPYKVGQFLPTSEEGNLHVKRQVTGYDDKGMPITEIVSTAPRHKPTDGTKPEMKPMAAVKRISQIDSAINTIKKGGAISAFLIAQNPDIAGLLESGDPKAKEAAVESLKMERAEVLKYTPESYRKQQEKNAPPAPASAGTPEKATPEHNLSQAVQVLKEKKADPAYVITKLRKEYGREAADEMIRNNPELYALLKDRLL
jgi:hypothetical protein